LLRAPRRAFQRRLNDMNDQKGIALLVVLWVLAILMVMVLSFSVMTRADTFGLLSFKEGMENKFMAEAGIERAIMEIIFRSVNFNQAVTLVGKEPWKTDGTSYSVDLGGGGYLVRIIDETGKISLNGMTDSSGIVLKNLLINQNVSPENADIIVDSILDWKDEDDLHRLNGAENDYYMSLPNPYQARNADFETLDELILVRGITPQILYGDGKTKGIIHFLSIQNKTPVINVSAAPREVLGALPGMNEAMVTGLMEFRASAEIRSIEDVKNIIGDSYSLMAPYALFAAGGAAAYTIEAVGFKGSKKKGYAIEATVIFDGPHQHHYTYYKSPAELSP
jgi:general secretion pathway protein K